MNPASETVSKKNHVLIVEDSPTQAARLEYLLESEGFEVTVAGHGLDAIEKLKERLPSIIVSDVIMPGMDGYEFCHRIKVNEEWRGVPVVLLTTLADPGDIFKGLESGADHYLLKPYDEDILISRIRSILAETHLRKSNKSQMGIEITYAGQQYFINADRIQILDLLLATFENVVRKNRELEQTNQELKQSLETNKILRGLLPICSYCKKIRDDKGYWEQVEGYVSRHTDASFSHGICPDCAKRYYGMLL